MPTPLMRYFTYEHLPPKLQAASKPICDLARAVDQRYPDGPEKTVGLRKLLEAKDCIVRCAVDAPDAEDSPDSEPVSPSTQPSPK